MIHLLLDHYGTGDHDLEIAITDLTESERFVEIVEGGNPGRS